MEITIEGKTWTMHDTLFVKEYRRVVGVLEKLTDYAPALKDPELAAEKLNDIIQSINKITVDQFKFIEEVTKRCYKIADTEFEETHHATILLLFSELVNATRQPKKKLETPSSSESTTETTLNS